MVAALQQGTHDAVGTRMYGTECQSNVRPWTELVQLGAWGVESLYLHTAFSSPLLPVLPKPVLTQALGGQQGH